MEARLSFSGITIALWGLIRTLCWSKIGKFREVQKWFLSSNGLEFKLLGGVLLITVVKDDVSI